MRQHDYERSFSGFEVAIFFVVILFSGCQEKSRTSGTNRRSSISQTDQTIPGDDDPKDPPAPNKPISKPKAPVNSPKQVSPTPKLPTSKLNWDGSRIIGTDQLYLIPIE